MEEFFSPNISVLLNWGNLPFPILETIDVCRGLEDREIVAIISGLIYPAHKTHKISLHERYAEFNTSPLLE